MSYFRELPNLEYQSFLSDKQGSDDYLLVKNIFRRVKLRDDLQNVFTVFDKYQIPDGSRPELVAEELYGSSQYDWIVLVCAGITRVRDQWPLSDAQIYEYSEEIYGENLNSVHHYETTEVRDSQDKLILPAGKVVDSNFTIYDPNDLKQVGFGTTASVRVLNPVIGISNYEYEIKKNNDKRSIYILKPRYLQQVILDTRKAMTYDKSSQYVNDTLIRTENTNLLGPH